MKRILLPLIVSILLTGTVFADEPYVYRFGQYNIRIITNDDTGDLAWAARKGDVANIVRNHDFDVWSMNECKAGTQYSSLKELLPEYEFVVHGVTSTTIAERETMNGVAFKRDLFDMLDHGRFFISADPLNSARLISDSRQQRGTVWVKLRNKQNGEEFFYFATHLDHIGWDARREGVRINTEMVRKIAGNYPVILGGDHNCGNNTLYVTNCMQGYFKDAGIVMMPASSRGTCNGNRSSNPSQYNFDPIDHIYYHNVNLVSFEIIRDAMATNPSIMPSDHAPIMIKATLGDFVPTRTKYVDCQAAEGGSGTKAAPYQSLQTALDAIEQGDTICMAEGLYAPELTSETKIFHVRKSATIIGGYDHSFSTIAGKTTLSATNTPGLRIMTIDTNQYLELSDIIFTDAKCNVDGGAIYSNGNYLTLTACEFSNNNTSGNAAIFTYGQVTARDCSFHDNTATGMGGAIYTYHPVWRHTFNNCRFEHNTAKSGAACYIAAMRRGYWKGCAFIDNSATESGAALYLGNSTNQALSVTFLNNTFTGNVLDLTNSVTQDCGGSAIYAALLYDEAQGAATTLNLVANTIVDNTIKNADDNTLSGAIALKSGYLGLYNNIIIDNEGGDVALTGTLVNSQNNIYTDATTLSGYTTSTTDILKSPLETEVGDMWELLASRVDDGKTIILPVKTTTFGGKNVVSVAASWQTENALNTDLNDDTAIMTQKYTDDQLGKTRKSPYTIGAVEYDATLSIEEHNPQLIPHNQAYNLAGQRVTHSYKGIIIINGRKTFKH